ncbi:MAG: Unknown protein [uncultured Sulfurovum sp.]|uniref:Lipoprotein n=1 Tax=uncultured Sulfurovum sp. TaxID=269237 RepID=A0A6S6TFL0_9BACT|nr:MAG: Unknown protein [uncultured Sulfurovum sp.]
MKYGVTFLLSMFVFVGCSTTQPKVIVSEDKKEVVEINKIESVVVENNVSQVMPVEEHVPVIDDENVILSVFSDELYFEKDKVGTDKTKVIIKYLDAFDWEKKALRKAYAKNKRLWSKKQSESFWKILEEDKYLSLCSNQRYWDNLQFEESEPERDILHSILFIKYLNNLSNGCPQWVESKVKNENSKQFINTKEIFSLLPHEVIIEKLFYLYTPHSKKFDTLMNEYRTLTSSEMKEDTHKAERLQIEEYKRNRSKPQYKNK